MTPAKAAAAAREFSCGLCWQRAGLPCNHRGDHLARYLHGESEGLLFPEDVAAAVARAGSGVPHAYVPVSASRRAA